MPPRSKEDDVRAFLPLKPLDYLILLALTKSELHGYAIVRDIEERSDGAVDVEAGNLYRSIRRLLDAKLLTESDKRPAPDLDDERRRYYSLSTLGRRVLAAESLRLRALIRYAEARRIIRPETS